MTIDAHMRSGCAKTNSVWTGTRAKGAVVVGPRLRLPPHHLFHTTVPLVQGDGREARANGHATRFSQSRGKLKGRLKSLTSQKVRRQALHPWPGTSPAFGAIQGLRSAHSGGLRRCGSRSL